jgi:hypothetical protein
MLLNQILKYSFALLLNCFFALPLQAQLKKMPFQISPDVGVPFNLLNKDIYSAKPLNISKQFGGTIQLGISKHIAVSIEGQYRNFSLQKNLEATYNNMLKNDPLAVRSFQVSNIRNGLLGLNYYRYNKKGNSLFEIGVAGGLQQLTQGKNILAFHNPYRLGLLDTVYQNGGKVNSGIGQFTLQNTFYIGKRLGIRVGVKTQYAPALYNVTYNKIPSSKTDEQISFQEFCKTTTITQTAFNPISIIPTVGITIALGGSTKEKKLKPKKDKEDKKPKTGCFTLSWKNQPKKNECFQAGDLNFGISAPSNLSNVIKYEVSIAPVNDLSNPQFLFDLPYPSAYFSIDANTMNPKINYIVIVKMIYLQSGLNCAQSSTTINRCNEPCAQPEDSKLNEVPPKNKK